MNKVYKVIWNKVKHCYVVVSEIAKSNGKSAAMKMQSGKSIAAALTVFALCLGMTGVVSAAENTEGTGMGVAIGAGSVATDNAAVAVGINSKAEHSSSVAIGNEATAEEGFSIAIGKKSTASKNGAIAMGTESKATDSAAVAIGGGSEADLSGTAIGHGTQASGYSTAIGLQSKTTGFGDIALGYTAKSSGMGATAIGGEAAANADHAIAVGSFSKGKGEYSTAIGTSAQASGTSAMAIGPRSQASAESALALGNKSIANIIGGVAVGSDSKTNVAAGVTGYDPSGKYATDPDELLKKGTPWKSTLAAVSVGNSEKGYTRQITNVAAGTLDTDAVNVAQLKALNEKVDNSALSSGKNITVHTTTDTNGVKKNTIDLNDSITFGSDTAPEKEVKVDGTKGQVVIGNAAKGSGLVIGNQDVTTTSNKKESGKFITGLSNITWDKMNIVKDRAATEGELKDVADSIKGISETVGMGTREFVGDETSSDKKVSVKLGETMNLKGGADVTNLSDGNIGVVTNSNKDGFDIKLSKDIKGLNSVTTGNTTINNDGLKIVNEDSSKNITIQNNNVNMGGNVITNIGEGTNPTDAINKNQFDREISQINNGMGQVNNRISNLDNRVDRVGAGAAALAALHPLDFDPTSRWEVSAGVGNYRGANAVAVGAFYRPNYDTMVSIGSSYGGGENMVNAGVTFRIGEGTTKVYSSQDALSREVDSLRSVVDEQNRKLESQSQQLTAQNNKIESQSEQLAAQNNKIEAQNSKIEAQSRQLESQGKQLAEQSRQIAQLMQAVAELKK